MRSVSLWGGVVILGVLNVLVWNSLLARHSGKLTVSVLDIGQGDSILVQGPTGIRMLVDGGPDQSVLRKLPEVIGLFAQQIDMVVETHPDKDHISGLVDILKHYRISYFLTPGIPGTTATFRALEDAVRSEPGARSFLARRGMRIHLGGGAYADVLYPDRDMSNQKVTNDGSITLQVVYRNTSFMLTGDLSSKLEEHLVSLDPDSEGLKTDVLKAGHHGSKSSTSERWLATVQPSMVAISAGEGNSYGHPNEETLERIRDAGAQIISTIDRGTLSFVSDGTRIVLETER